VTNALSEWLEVEVYRNGKVYMQRYERGVPQAPVKPKGTTDDRGTKVTFKPDGQIFPDITLSFDTLSNRLRELAFLNPGTTITIIDERDDKEHTFFYEGGIIEFVRFLNGNKSVLHPSRSISRKRKTASWWKWPSSTTTATTSRCSRSSIISTPSKGDPCDRVPQRLDARHQ